jgi:GNAT superfamily N-acetyltransferase
MVTRPGPSVDLLAAAARNCGEAYAFPSRRMGRPFLATELVVGADLGLPVAAPTNSATLLRPPTTGEITGLLAELRRLFSGPGGGWTVWDPWSALDLADEGFIHKSTPCMVRRAGGSAPAAPRDLSVAEVRDSRTLEDMTTVVMGGYEIPPECTEFMWTVDAFGDRRYRAWVGYVDGRPVTTSAAYVGAGLVGVYVVATIPEARGRGYGEALTWVATLSAPELDATLQASDMGRRVYERMGFETISAYSVWTTDVRAALT